MPREARPQVNGEVDAGERSLAEKMRSWCLQREGAGAAGGGGSGGGSGGRIAGEVFGCEFLGSFCGAILMGFWLKSMVFAT